MNNQELEQCIREILANDNIFDMIIAAKNFESEYKRSDFYKQTKMNLEDAMRQAKVHYALQAEPLKETLQNLINSLDLSHLDNLMNQVAEIYGKENAETARMIDELKDFKEIIKER